MATWAGQDGPVTEWLRVLDDIEGVVVRRLAATEEPPPAADAPPAQTPLQARDERMSRMGARLDRAEHDAREADGVLHGEAEAHRRWAEEASAARRRLADRARGVGRMPEKAPEA